jgi:hypothetical protein
MAGTPPGGQYDPAPGGIPPQQQGGGYPQQQQPVYAQQPQYGAQGQQGGPGLGERAADFARSVRTPETKPFFKTSEFIVWAITVLAVLIAGAVEGGDDGGGGFGATTVWTLVTVISFAYVISRGISKAGTKYDDSSGHRY